MLIVAERINASRKAIRAALETTRRRGDPNEARSAGRGRRALHRRQRRHFSRARGRTAVLAGGRRPGRDRHCRCASTVPIRDALAAALPRVKGARPMINSINLERDRFDARAAARARAPRQADRAVRRAKACPRPRAAEKVELAIRAGRATDAGGHGARRHLRRSAGVSGGHRFAIRRSPRVSAMREIMARFPGVHTICGLTNVSHGLPARKLVNRTFLAGAIANGMDAAIVDPTDAQLDGDAARRARRCSGATSTASTDRSVPGRQARLSRQALPPSPRSDQP